MAKNIIIYRLVRQRHFSGCAGFRGFRNASERYRSSAPLTALGIVSQQRRRKRPLIVNILVAEAGRRLCVCVCVCVLFCRRATAVGY